MTKSLEAERDAIELAFDHFDEFCLIGGALMDGDNMYGFTYGSDVGENIFSVHIEKADRTVTGAYLPWPALCARRFRNVLLRLTVKKT